MAPRFEFVHRNNRQVAVHREFDITAFVEPGQLYRLGWELIFGNDGVPDPVDFRALSRVSPFTLFLPDDIMPGHIVHENLPRPVAGQVGLVMPTGRVFLLVLQWRRQGMPNWEWYTADTVDWQTFRANVGEVYAHCILLVQLNLPVPPAVNSEQHFLQEPRRDVQVMYQTFGTHRLRRQTLSRPILTPLGIYGLVRGLVFGNDFLPVYFGCMTSRFNVQVFGTVHGQPGINAQRQLALLVIKWCLTGEEGNWHFYMPQQTPGEDNWFFYIPHQIPWHQFQTRVRAIHASGVLLAQF